MPAERAHWARCATLPEWWLISARVCAGGIKMLPSDNNSPVFLGLNFSNLKGLIKARRPACMALHAPRRLQLGASNRAPRAPDPRRPPGSTDWR